MQDLQKKLGMAIIMVTHDLGVIASMCDEIMVMYLGQCVERAPSKELFANPQHPYTKALLAAIPVPDVSMRHKEIQVIKGELTSPINPKPGCRFASRCPYATEACTAQDIPAKDLGGGHVCSCVLV